MYIMFAAILSLRAPLPIGGPTDSLFIRRTTFARQCWRVSTVFAAGETPPVPGPPRLASLVSHSTGLRANRAGISAPSKQL